MPSRPTPDADSQVLAPGYAANAPDSTQHHEPGFGPTAFALQAQVNTSNNNHQYQQQHQVQAQALGDLGQYLTNEAHAVAAAALVSLHHPLASDPSHPPPSDSSHTHDSSSDSAFDDGSADTGYGDDDTSSDGYADLDMTGTEGSGGAPWEIPQINAMEPTAQEAGALMGLAPFAFAHPPPFLGHGVVVEDIVAHFAPPLHVQAQFSVPPAIADLASNTVYPPATLQAVHVQQPDNGAPSADLPQPTVVSNPHFGPLGPENLGLMDFLTYWARLGNFSQRMRSSSSRVPYVSRVADEAARRPSTIKFNDLLGDEMDPQGIDWKLMGITRGEARERRHLTYRNYVNKPGSDKWRPCLPDTVIPNTESYFRFSRMDIRQNVHLSHFQLRNLLACSGQTHAFYPGRKAVHRLNPLSGQSEVAMNLSDISHVQISTLDAGCDLVVAGTFSGEYCMRNIHATDKNYARGQITNNATSGITNHLQIHRGRSSNSPRVAFSSNDQGYRVMDAATGQFILDTRYSFPMNCSAISADRRLRVLVGDSYEALIVNAETGEIVQELRGHRDFGFACDWSEDGWTVATAAQDRGIKIWDARRWTDSKGRCTPVTTLRSEMAGARGLRFSPAGSGPRVLVATEEADFINIIDAQTFRRKQTFDIFGEIGGVSFNDDGKTLNILCCDRNRGGVVQLDRYDYGPRWSVDDDYGLERGDAFEYGMSRARAPQPIPKRRRLYLDDLEPF